MNTKSEELLKSYEEEILEAWHIAQGNKKIPFKVTLTQAGLCAERICQAIYIRRKNKEPSTNMTFFKLTNLFYKEALFDIQMKTMLNAIRTSAANRRHKSITIEKAFIDKMRLFLIDIVLWYQKTYKMRFANLQLSKYKSILYKRPVHAYYTMNKSGHLSDENFEKNLQNEVLLKTPLEDKTLFRTPVYASLLIDVSGSMQPHVSNVILGHKEALSAIRGSMICKQKALFLMQHVFNHESQLLNTLTRVDASANDTITTLNQGNYRPHSTTALYDTLYEAINLICSHVNSLKVTKGKKPEIVIGVMTDGIDNQSRNYSPGDIRQLMQFLEKESTIKSSVLIGWTNPNELSLDYLQKLQYQLGFNEVVALDQSDPKVIREAFNLWSSRVV